MYIPVHTEFTPLPCSEGLVKFSSIGPYGLLAVRDLYRATPAETPYIGTSPINMNPFYLAVL